MPKYLLQATDAEFDSWRAAARREGGERFALAKWIRRVLNEAAGPSVVPAGEYREFAPGEVSVGVDEDGVTHRLYTRSFTPDFGKRLKP